MGSKGLTVRGSSGSSLCLIFCLLHSLVTVSILMNDVIKGNKITCRISCCQYVVIGIWTWPLSRTLVCVLLVEALCSPLLEVYNAGVVSDVICWHQCDVLLPASFVCIWIYVHAKHWIQEQTSFCEAQAHRLQLCPFLESCSLTEPMKSPSACLKRNLADEGWNSLQTDIKGAAFFLCRRSPHLFTTRTGSTFLCRDQVSQIRRRSPSVDYWHCREGQPHGQNHRQATNHWSRTTGGHSEREPNAWCHLLIEMK